MTLLLPFSWDPPEEFLRLTHVIARVVFSEQRFPAFSFHSFGVSETNSPPTFSYIFYFPAWIPNSPRFNCSMSKQSTILVILVGSQGFVPHHGAEGWKANPSQPWCLGNQAIKGPKKSRIYCKIWWKLWKFLIEVIYVCFFFVKRVLQFWNTAPIWIAEQAPASGKLATSPRGNACSTGAGLSSQRNCQVAR